MNSSASVKLRYEKCLQIWGNAKHRHYEQARAIVAVPCPRLVTGSPRVVEAVSHVFITVAGGTAYPIQSQSSQCDHH